MPGCFLSPAKVGYRGATGKPLGSHWEWRAEAAICKPNAAGSLPQSGVPGRLAVGRALRRERTAQRAHAGEALGAALEEIECLWIRGV